MNYCETASRSVWDSERHSKRSNFQQEGQLYTQILNRTQSLWHKQYKKGYFLNSCKFSSTNFHCALRRNSSCNWLETSCIVTCHLCACSYTNDLNWVQLTTIFELMTWKFLTSSRCRILNWKPSNLTGSFVVFLRKHTFLHWWCIAFERQWQVRDVFKLDSELKILDALWKYSIPFVK